MMGNISGFYAFARRIFVALAAALLLIAAAPAIVRAADCATATSGTRPEGAIFYNTDGKLLQYCNGTEWIPMHAPGSGSGGCSTATAGGRPEGHFFYNTDHRVMQGCAGNIWRAMGPIGGTSSGATDWTSPQPGPVLNNPDPMLNDNFGFYAAMDGNIAVVGASHDDPGGVSDAGTAYVLDATSGNLIATLNNPDPTNTDNFGDSVAISGTIAVVGAWGDDPGGMSGAGSAYVFDTTDGSLIATLDNPNPTASDYFGRGVAVSGTMAVVGAPFDDPGGVNAAGTAYVFDATDGSLIATLNNPTPAFPDNFGFTVALSGNVAVVGARGYNPGGISNAGRAYVFDASDGSLIATLENPDPTANDYFGLSIAVDGNAVVVGVHQDDPGGVSDAGTAYAFDATDGSLIATLSNPDPEAGDNFGRSVALSGTMAVVGASSDKPDGVNAVGAAYLFDATDGSLIATLNNPDPTAGDYFGVSVALTGSIAVVGASSDDPGGVSAAGTAYIFTPGLPGACATPDRPEGALLYNSSGKVMQYCDGANWVQVGKAPPPVVDPCAGSPAVGALCADGSYYIGQLGGNDIYATDAASETSTTWNNGTTNYTVTGFTSTTDGPGNTAGLVASGDAGSPYAAANYCDGLTNVHGHSDWYLPAKDEMNLFWNGGSPVAGVLTDGTTYWMSTESTSQTAWLERFNDGTQTSNSPANFKQYSRAVRCVRRD